MDNFAIRIGSYDEHQNIVAAEEINRNTSPPDFHHKLCAIQRKFSLQIKDYLAPFLKHDKISMVKEWVCMKELKESPTPIFNSPKKARPKNVDLNTPSPSHATSSAITPSPTKTPEDKEGPGDDIFDTKIDDDSYGGGFEGDNDSLNNNDRNENQWCRSAFG